MNEKISHQSITTDNFQYDFSLCSQIAIDEVKDNSSMHSENMMNTFFTIFLFEKADGIHRIDGKEFSVKDFQMHLVFPGQVNECKYEKFTSVYKVRVPHEILDMFGNYLMFPISFYKKKPDFELPPEIFYKLLYEFRSIYNEIKKNENIWEIVLPRIRIITLTISKEACRQSFINSENIATKRLADFFKLVILNFRTERNVKFYADEMFLTPNYLNIICKRYFNKTASSVINNELILEIKMLLINSNKSIKEIAFDLGFRDLSGFSSFFSNNTGMSPRDFLMKYGRNIIH